MESQNQITVFFRPGLTAEELEARLQAIHLINGVERIESGHSEPYIPNPAAAPSDQQPDSIPRGVIEQALVWGVKQSLISAAEIHQKSPEELVVTALSMLDKMPESLRRQISATLQPGRP